MHGIRNSAAVALGMALVARGQMFANRIFGDDNIRRHIQSQKRTFDGSTSIATGNRHGGPHLHKREIARRQRQAVQSAA